MAKGFGDEVDLLSDTLRDEDFVRALGEKSTQPFVPAISLREVLIRTPTERRGECARVLTRTCIEPKDTHGSNGPLDLLHSFAYDASGNNCALLRVLPQAIAGFPSVLLKALTTVEPTGAPPFTFAREAYPPANRKPGLSRGIWFITSDSFDSEGV